jgi:hypothetical protein
VAAAFHGKVVVFTVCWRPARGRVLVAIVGLAALVLGVVFVTRRSRPAERGDPVPAPL